MEHKIALLGFGNVLKAFAELLLRKQDYLKQTLDTELKVVGIATNSKGMAINPAGIDLAAALQLVKSGQSLNTLHVGESVADTFAFIQQAPADIILEATVLDPRTGQPALDYVRAALNAGKHVVTANKGPVAFGYRELKALAQAKGLGFFFESTVMDGMPLHSIAREGMLGLQTNRIRGILNSTTNSVLTRLEEGTSFEEAVAEMQRAGLAETDPSNDIDGWDASVKITILANVVMGADLRPSDVDRTGIRNVTAQDAQVAVKAGKHIKLVCEAVREGDKVKTSVRPIPLPLTDPLANITQTASAVTFETDVLPNITLIEGNSSPTTTAYGMLVDALNIGRGRR
ncbi:MAG: homoserine dehydrogenase [Chloroflexota bacterium]|nr:homoserine dehydrogenase [Chloroflexota bacterium]NOG64142.1 homoserine dehydrogenase [Chloroflexota bacterium]GIK65803.1 MAG: homoserine dehydrogenase [Chloroflexota bacterium]